VAQHRSAEERRAAAETRAQDEAGLAQNRDRRDASSHASRERLMRVKTEMEELNAETEKAIAPLIRAGKKAEAMQVITDAHERGKETLAAALVEGGPEAVVDMMNKWPGLKANNVAEFRKMEGENGTEYAALDAQGNVITDQTTNQPIKISEKEVRGYYARHQARRTTKGKRNVVKAKDADGNEALVDADTGQLIGSMQLDEQDNPKWVPAGEGGQAPPPKPTGAPRPAIGEGPQPPKEAIDVLMAAMRGSDMEDRTAARKEFDEEFGPGTAALWIGRAQQEQQTQEQRQQQEARRQQEQQQEQARREREQQLAVQQAKSLLKVVDGPGIAPRGPDEPASEADAQFVEFFEANRDKLSQADRGMMLEMLPAYRNAKARLANAPKGIDPAAQKRDDFLGGIDAPSVPGVVFGRPPVPR
jgi:hypothetical protein